MKTNKWMILLILASIIGTMMIYNSLPEQMASHWNFSGEVDGYTDRSSIFFLALLPLGLYLLMVYLPKLDPKKASYLKHEKAYNIFVILLLIFLVLIQWVSILFNLGVPINIGVVVRLGIGILFIVTGNYMSQIRSNYSFGIKTPWTLANEEVWKKTHRVGGYGFILMGMVAMMTFFLSDKVGAIVMVAAFIVPIFYFYIYSYLEYKKIVKE